MGLWAVVGCSQAWEHGRQPPARGRPAGPARVGCARPAPFLHHQAPRPTSTLYTTSTRRLHGVLVGARARVKNIRAPIVLRACRGGRRCRHGRLLAGRGGGTPDFSVRGFVCHCVCGRLYRVLLSFWKCGKNRDYLFWSKVLMVGGMTYVVQKNAHEILHLSGFCIKED